MSVFNNLKLRSKMIWGFTLVIMLMIIALIFGMYGLLSIKQQFCSIKSISDEAKGIGKIQTEFLSSRIAFNNYVATENINMTYIFEDHYDKMRQYLADILKYKGENKSDEFITNIESELIEYNIGFRQIKEMNQEILEYNINIQACGIEMLDALYNIKQVAYYEEETDIMILASNSLEQLLRTRLYASKYLDDHKNEDYASYRKAYEKFETSIGSLKGIEEKYKYNSQYNIVMKNSPIYSNKLYEINNIINEIDISVRDMNNIGVSITNIIKQINEYIIQEEEGYEIEVQNQVASMIGTMAGIALIAILLSIFVAIKLLRLVLVPIGSLTETFNAIALGDVDLDFRLEENSNDEIGIMAKTFNNFMVKLKDIMSNINYQNWLKTAQTELNELLRDEEDIIIISNKIISYLCNYIGANIGAVYISDDCKLSMVSSYAYGNRKGMPRNIKYGEGLIGQAAIEKKSFVITQVPEDYIVIQSGLGEAVPNNIMVLPCMYQEKLICIIEIGSLETYSKEKINLLEALSDVIGISINSAKSRNQMKVLLDKTIIQAEELQMQQEELRQSNEELEEQATSLKKSELSLQNQQEELRVSNEELSRHSRELELQKKELHQKNEENMASQQLIINKANALETANRYKTEFLANMSHELRTPLNSILILSQLLSNHNISEPLTKKEREYASTINSSGKDLLTLINGVLDLSKVEAGKLELNLEKVYLNEIIDENIKLFKQVADIKNIKFKTKLQEDMPEYIISDAMRLSQIIKNLISNAIKFTHIGEVILSIRRLNESEYKLERDMNKDYIAIEVTDTGIGIPKDKQKLIFEAFCQSDGTTSRQYGGTGLGLTISLELSHVLGGQILVESKEGKGSTFTIILPLDSKTDVKEDLQITNNIIGYEELHIDEKSDTLKEETTKKTMLIIEDDKKIANILADLASNKGYETQVVFDGEQGLKKAISIQPSAIILDIGLPDINGIDLARKLENHEKTKNIPIHIISGSENNNVLDMPKSIIGYLKKPVDVKVIYETLEKLESIDQKELKKVIVVGTCGEENFEYLFDLGQVEIEKVKTGKEGLECIEKGDYQCVVLDVKLPDMKAIDFLTQLKEELGQSTPVIIYTDEEMEGQQITDINQYVESIILKSSKSKERLIDEVLAFLQDMNEDIEEYASVTVVESDKEDNQVLFDKKVLLVDDDERNLFALSNALEQYGMKVIIAKNGKEAIKKQKENIDFDIILMDIMMPKLNGYEAIKKIRKLEFNNKIPIIALTAKAMKDDRNKCIEAGANDYMTKPIDTLKLISLLKRWL